MVQSGIFWEEQFSENQSFQRLFQDLCLVGPNQFALEDTLLEIKFVDETFLDYLSLLY